MNNNPRTGVFICKCGNKIEPQIDLNIIINKLKEDAEICHCQIIPYSCLKPGIEKITEAIADNNLNRIIIAGCEERLMLKKFETELKDTPITKKRIKILNIRGHIASVSDINPELKAIKSVRLIKAAAADINSLKPIKRDKANVEGQIMILGNGAALYSAAAELLSSGHKCILFDFINDYDKALANIREKYPGDRDRDKFIENTIKRIKENPNAKIITEGKVKNIFGITGGYGISVENFADNTNKIYKVAAVIACLDGKLEASSPEYEDKSGTVISMEKIEKYINANGVLNKKIVFLINDYEIKQPEFAKLSLDSAWKIGRRIRESYHNSHATILFNHKIPIPLTSAERKLSRELKISWIPYSDITPPILQQGYIVYCDSKTNIEEEISFDWTVLAPKRSIGYKVSEIMRLINVSYIKGEFIFASDPKVRPEMIGCKEAYVAGSAFYPCNLSIALTQGRQAARKVSEMLNKSNLKELIIPDVISYIDPEKCVACGLCEQLCENGSISVSKAEGGALTRIIDPMRCTGGGTCAASCPYNAIILQNNTCEQKENGISVLASQMEADQIIALTCAWAGTPAADNAGKKGIKYDHRAHIVPVTCAGQLDPSIFAKAFVSGASGLIIIGCDPNACHHSYGIDHAWSRVNAIKKLFTISGINRRRIALAHTDIKRAENFAVIINHFVKTIEELGPIEKTTSTTAKLNCIYEIMKYDSRIRHLIAADLRLPYEQAYRGDHAHIFDYDKDITKALREEFLKTRIKYLLKTEKAYFTLDNIVKLLEAEKNEVSKSISEMISEALIECEYKKREPLFFIKD
ncbi:MAG: hydrogenase iron-sulfur subunit [Deltaproteobacteria bacterium]|nr:hydrogenase iron-sulfur subunit [Deltaproteobacteria bacterium]